MDENYQNKITIKTWAEEDRPREKLLNQGRRTLTDAELVAILIGSGSTTETAVELSRRILNACNNDLNALAKLTVTELCKFKGIGEAKAISIIAALEIGRRRKESDVPETNKIATSKDIFITLAPHFTDLLHEEFWIILLNKANKVLNKVLISKGGQSATVVDAKIIFKAALENNAASIVMAHNHPSGNLRPSLEDINLTKKIVSAAKLLDFSILDHIIMTDKAYYSFADEGNL